MSDDEPTRLKPGEIVTARVKRVAVFGLFLDYRGLDLLLLIPETSWIACYASCDQLADVGDEFRVRGGRLSGRLGGENRAYGPGRLVRVALEAADMDIQARGPGAAA